MPAPYLRALILRSWWRIALCAIFVGLGVLAASYFFFPVYESSSLVEVQIHSSNSVYVADRIGHNEAILATSSGILEYAAKRNPPLTAAHLKSKVSAILEPNSHMIQITVQDTNAARAASVANDIAYALVTDQNENAQAANLAAQKPTQQQIATTQQQITQTQDQIKSLGTPPSNPTQAATLQAQLTSEQTQLNQEESALQQIRIAQGSSTILLVVAGKALPADAPLTTRLVEYTVAGIVGGSVLGLALVLLLDWLNWRVRSSAEVHTLLGVDVLGEVNRAAIADTGGYVTEATYNTLRETYQSLAQAIEFSSIDKPLRTIALLSPERIGASQSLASGLAISLAASGRRTLLVDGYLVTGRQARQFGVANTPGLSDAALAARAASADEIAPITYARQPTNMPASSLLVLPGGTPPPNADKVLASRSMDRTLSALPQSGADVVLYDSPPLLGRVGLTAGAKAFLKHADGALLVVDLGRTRKYHLLLAQTLLAEAETPVVGCVVVGPPEPAGVAMPPARNAPPPRSAAPSMPGYAASAQSAPSLDLDAPLDPAPDGQATTLRAGRPRAARGAQ